MTIIRAAIVVYDIAVTATAPFVASWLTARFGIGYVALYIVAAPAVSYAVWLVTDRLEDRSLSSRASGATRPGRCDTPWPLR